MIYMATLKISELSVGDWVRWNAEYGNPQIVRVTEIHWNCIVGVCNGVEYAMRRSNIDPIPITAEVLEKNGFERLLERDLFYHSESGLEVAFEDGEWEHTTNLHEYTIHTISGVHHIQHLLRLYGCEKEINL